MFIFTRSEAGSMAVVEVEEENVFLCQEQGTLVLDLLHLSLVLTGSSAL